MSNREDFEKWLRSVDEDQSITLAAGFPRYASYVTCLIAEAWQARQPEIDALKLALSKSNVNMERVERELYLKINELEAEVESLERRLIEEKS